LTRFGDLLQTQPVFTGLKRLGHATGLVCLRNFQGAAALLRHMDAVHPVAGERFLADLDASWPMALGGCLSWIDQVRAEFRPDRVINLTPSLPARLLARLLARSSSNGEALGFAVDEFGFGAYSTPWAAFLEATSRHRGSSPFNLVDLFFKSAHLGDAPREFSLADPAPQDVLTVKEMIASQISRTGTGADHAGLVGMQLGASAAKRQWPVESFARTAEFLWERHRLLPVILGSKDELPLAGEFASKVRAPHANLAGATNLGELGAAVGSLRLLVTNDTGTMHLAAGLNVPILAIFLATAQPWDTGPYLPGALCLEPDMDCHPCPFSHQCAIDFACRTRVDHEAVCAYLDGFVSRGSWPELSGLGVRAWECVRSSDGFLDLSSRSGHGGGQRAVWNAVQRAAWRRFLDGEPVEFQGHEADGLPMDFRAGLHDTLAQASGLLEVLLQQARVLAAAPRAPMRAKFMATWQRLDSLFASHASLSALAHLWMHLSQSESHDLEQFVSFAQRVSGLVSSLSSLLAPRP
jgi:ADP-heptose:LPS heptosyltransferase